jgi:hypothetical protein
MARAGRVAFSGAQATRGACHPGCGRSCGIVQRRSRPFAPKETANSELAPGGHAFLKLWGARHTRSTKQSLAEPRRLTAPKGILLDTCSENSVAMEGGS